MKKIRTLSLLLGALSGAAALSVLAAPSPSGPPPVKIPPPGQIHQSYHQTPVAIYTLYQAMPAVASPAYPTPVNFDGTVTWKVYIEEAGGKLKNRAASWMVGTITNPVGKALDVDLHMVGAQHHTEIVWLRVVSSDPTVAITLVEDAGAPVSVLQKVQGHPGYPDFYEIQPSMPQKIPSGMMVKLDKRYRLTSKDSTCVVEVFYDKHQPGSSILQLEDGGPPAIPPPAEN